jgi:hypothetical protein
MSIEFETENKDDHLLVRMKGTFRLDEFLDLLEKAYQIAEHENRNKIFADLMALDGTMTVSERFTMGECFADLSLKHMSIIAIAVVGHEPLMHPQKFGETVALNRGARGKVFTDYDEAVNWLFQSTT